MENQIGPRIRRLRKQLDMTQEDLAEKTGFKTKGAISRIENGQRNITQDQIISFAKVLRTTPSYLMGWEDEKDLPCDVIPLHKVNKIPILGEIACGEPILTAENYQGYVFADFVNASFAVRAKGDSMIDAGIEDGDYCFIREQADIENDEIAAVLIGDETTLKKVYKTDDAIILMAENDNFKPIKLNKDIKILGKLVGIYHDIK